MKHLFIKLTLIVTVFISGIKTSHATDIHKEKDCFSGKWASVESLMEAEFSKLESREELQKAKKRYLNPKFKKNFNRYKETLNCRTFFYMVDNNPVAGYVIEPAIVKAKLPVIIFNRGGNNNFSPITMKAMMKTLFPIAEHGFVIIGSQYRGTFVSESPITDEYGGRDVNDVVALLPLLKNNVKTADLNRIGMFGVSRGGMQTFLALKAMPEIKAVVIKSGLVDLFSSEAHRQEKAMLHAKLIPGYDKNRVAELTKRSVVKWADTLSKDVPILILHGTKDRRDSVETVKNLAQIFDAEGQAYKLVLYPGDDHFLSQNKKESKGEIINWFKKYL